MKQNIITLKWENTKWKNSLVEEQGLIFQWYLEKINQHIKENKKREKELSDEINNKLNEINKNIDKYITSLDKKIENQTKELAKLAKKTKILQIFLYYIVWPMVLLMIWFLIYSIKFIF
jgi:predicted  nucleic acid-binding Zn-ribbon protein